MIKDDTFEELQVELDALLHRIKLCMQHERLENMEIELEYTTKEDAAKAIYCYAILPKSKFMYVNRSLKEAAAFVYSAELDYKRRLSVDIDLHGDVKGPLVSAIDVLSKWDNFFPLPLHEEHMFSLSYSARALNDNASLYFGQESGLKEIKKSAVDQRKIDRGLAAFSVAILNLKDPKKYPIGIATWEKVGEELGMSASTVRDACRNPEFNFLQRFKKEIQKKE